MRTRSRQLLDEARLGLQFASRLEPKATYSIKRDGVPAAGSAATAYRRLRQLAELNLAGVWRGNFWVRHAARQPAHVLEALVPSLLALKRTRRFGKSYNDADVGRAKRVLGGGIVTLDYRAWEITGYQAPHDLYVYVRDVPEAARALRDDGFSEGRRGRVAVLEMTPETEDSAGQVYLDSVARGGRSILDAIAIWMKCPNEVPVDAKFSLTDVAKVQDDMQRPDYEKADG